jgi:hypothetical protein
VLPDKLMVVSLITTKLLGSYLVIWLPNMTTIFAIPDRQAQATELNSIGERWRESLMSGCGMSV